MVQVLVKLLIMMVDLQLTTETVHTLLVLLQKLVELMLKHGIIMYN